MSTIIGSQNGAQRSQYAPGSRSTKAAAAFVAVLASSMLLGGTLGLFEMRSERAAFARSSVKAVPTTDGLALRATGPGRRG